MLNQSSVHFWTFNAISNKKVFVNWAPTWEGIILFFVGGSSFILLCRAVYPVCYLVALILHLGFQYTY